MLRVILATVLLLTIPSAKAAMVTSVGTGTAVTTADRVATFNGFLNETPQSLLGYEEGDLIVSVNDAQCCYIGQHYGSGGNDEYVTIATSDGADFRGLEVDVGSGFSSITYQTINVVWEALRNGGSIDSGVLSVSNLGMTVLGWSDSSSFDTLRISAGLGNTAFGQYQAIRLDNVKIEFAAPAPVPLPAAAWLLLSGLGGLGLLRKRKAA